MMVEFITRLRFLFFRKKRHELDEELRFHLEQSIAAKTAAGFSPEEVRQLALVEFGDVERKCDQCEQQRPELWMNTLAQDVRYGVCVLRRSPGFTVPAIRASNIGVSITINDLYFALQSHILS